MKELIDWIKENIGDDAIGIFLMIIAIVIYSLGEYGQGYKKGLKRGSEIAIEAVEEHLKEKEHDI